MPQILITPAAENDLINIWLYIARNNPDAADRTYHAAQETFETLVDMPTMGTLNWTNLPPLIGLRFFPIKRLHNYVVYYRETKEGIEIVRVLHSRMDKNRRLEQDT